MTAISIQQLDEQIRRLPPDKLVVVYDFVSYLLERELAQILTESASAARETMLLSEAVLQREWDQPEEDSAWAHL